MAGAGDPLLISRGTPYEGERGNIHFWQPRNAYNLRHCGMRSSARGNWPTASLLVFRSIAYTLSNEPRHEEMQNPYPYVNRRQFKSKTKTIHGVRDDKSSLVAGTYANGDGHGHPHTIPHAACAACDCLAAPDAASWRCAAALSAEDICICVR